MSKQSEAILEEQLVAQLQQLGYKYALINSEKELIQINVCLNPCLYDSFWPPSRLNEKS